MRVTARHRRAPLVALSDGSIIDINDLEVIGNGEAAGSGWELDLDDEPDPRWVEIAKADSASLSVTEKRLSKGERTFRAPNSVKQSLITSGVDTPLAQGQGLTLAELEQLFEEDIDPHAVDWISATLNKHQDNPDQEEEDALFRAAAPELDYAVIDAASDGFPPDEDSSSPVAIAVTTAAAAADGSPEQGQPVSEPPPGQFSKVIYMAIIAPDDTESVQDLVALVQTPQGAADAYTFQGGNKGWKEDPSYVAKLNSPAPPPIKQLEDWQVSSIIDQMNMVGGDPGPEDAEPDASSDSDAVQASAYDLLESGVIWGPDGKSILSIVATASNHAKGHLDGAERLRQYWEHGKGAGKIGWGLRVGAYNRCVRHLSRYLGERAHGYCAIRFHHVTGVWPGSKINGGRGGHHHG